jgi:putative endonuclease
MYTIYILKCNDDTFYTGSTNDLEKRLIEHNTSSKGAKYTRGRRPVEVVYCESCEDLSTARRREAAIKRMSREEKLDLFSTQGSNPCVWGK